MVTDVFAGFFFSSRRRHTRWPRDWSSDVCSSDLQQVVFVDDAHMMSRSVFYDEPVAFGLGDIDVAVWSLDKHVPGPRGAAIAGRQDVMPAIMAQVFQFGLEAQSGHYVAMLRGMEAFNVEPVRQAGELARALFQRLTPKFGTHCYQGGPSVSFSA